MKEMTVYLIWRSEVTIEVDDDFEWTGDLEDFSDDQLEVIDDTSNLELVDWSDTYVPMSQR
jgi:hypothetical protein